MHSSLTGVSSSASVALCSILQIHQMTSHCPLLSFSLTYSFRHRNTDTHTYPRIYMHVCTPASLSSPSNLGSLSDAAYLIGRFFFRFCSLQRCHMSHAAPPPKTNTSLCLSPHINSRPPVFTKCLFNENCFVSSLSECLMVPVLLQVQESGRDIWHRKADPRTKTNNTHAHTCLHTLLHAHKHFTFQPHWVSSKSRSAYN